MIDLERYLLALLLGLAWLSWTGWLLLRNRNGQLHLGRPSSLLVIYASQTGRAQAMASEHARQHGVAALTLNGLSREQLTSAQRIDFFVSTYGDGEPPDNGLRFRQLVKRLTGRELSNLTFSVTALGDSRYPAFCAFGYEVADVLQAMGAQLANPILCLDASQPSDSQRDDCQMLSLLRRERLNPDSRASGLFELQLEPGTLTWHPTDWVDIQVPDPRHPNRFLAPRTYSIASAAESGVLRLIVRQQRTSDGNLGAASGFLTESCSVGSLLRVRLRANPLAPEIKQSQPMLLIGAGSGLAGIYGVLESRALAACWGPAWLIYGERDPDRDQPKSNELQRWLKESVLTRLDKVFSQYPEAPEYVQDRMLSHAADIKKFLGENGCVYVCGSLSGMGVQVEDALHKILGQQGLQKLINEERYHRDLY